jgi:5-formyltetrahydrofolate cyclo-ligase
MDGIATQKQALRAQMSAARAALPLSRVTADSKTIMDRIMALNGYRLCGTVLCYLDFKNEVMTQALISDALSAGKNMLVPVILPGPDGIKAMYASRITGSGRMVSGMLGVREPENLQIADPESIDVFIVPGIAFDTRGNRLGFGGGYIDRFMPRLRPDCLTVAPAYDFQVHARIPAGENDWKVKLIVTEKRMIGQG